MLSVSHTSKRCCTAVYLAVISAEFQEKNLSNHLFSEDFRLVKEMLLIFIKVCQFYRSKYLTSPANISES